MADISVAHYGSRLNEMLFSSATKTVSGLDVVMRTMAVLPRPRQTNAPFGAIGPKAWGSGCVARTIRQEACLNVGSGETETPVRRGSVDGRSVILQRNRAFWTSSTLFWVLHLLEVEGRWIHLCVGFRTRSKPGVWDLPVLPASPAVGEPSSVVSAISAVSEGARIIV